MKNGLILLIVIPACEQKKDSINETMETKMITASGLAQNGKAGALVVADDNTVYYLDGMDAWEPGSLGRRIEVTGN